MYCVRPAGLTTDPGDPRMIIDMDVVNLSRLQFALTAMYHFLFVPLTLGLSFMLAIMETVYVMTGRPIWRTITQFWGTLFGINFALGVATGITMEFQFGTNWAYYSHYVGDIFGAPLAIEGLMAFFLEATFVGLFFFGWSKLSRVQHLVVTYLVAIGTNFSALWILIANGWMQNPTGASFNPDTMRMEVTNFAEVLFNPVAQAKFVHTVSAGYVTAAMFVLSVSAFYLLRGRHRDFAKRSLTVAASFGLASALSVVVLGDESGYATTEHQKMKLAAMEAMWHTEAAPAGFYAFAVPDMDARENYFTLHVPYVFGLIATRSFNTEIPGIVDLVDRAERRIRTGLPGYAALLRLQADPNDTEAKATVLEHQADLGYAMLLSAFTNDPLQATDAQIKQAAWMTVPHVPTLFWAFRLMVGLGFFFIALFAAAFVLSCRRALETPWFLRIAFFSLPLPWIAAESGWLVAEFGRQPWAVEGVLPTFLAASSLTAGHLWVSLSGFVLLYSTLAVVEMYLMVRAVRKGPEHADDPQLLLPEPRRMVLPASAE
jgi:cytochrome bd ubiquinol oxidase subunit I